MSVGPGPKNISFTASEAIAQNAAVIYNTTSNKVENCDAVTDKVFGIALQAATADGDKITVSFEPVVYAVVDDTVEPGEELSCSTTAGRLLKHDAQTNTVFVGKALKDGVQGDLIPVQIYGYQPASA